MTAKIVDQHGREITRGEIARARIRGLIGNPGAPYDAADRSSAEMAGWNAVLGSPDTETGPNRDLAVARIRDMVRNDGWAAGTVTRTLDASIGADFRLSAKPDYRALARRFGGAFDVEWAKEFADAAEAAFRAWGEDPCNYGDAEEKHSFSQKARLAFRHYLVEGEALGPIDWMPERVGYGAARYATAMHLVDPDRLSNPNGTMDTLTLRGGVELDARGLAPVAYHIRQAHEAEWWAAGRAVTWQRVPRRTSWGRPSFVHHYDADRAGDHRPVGGIFTPVLARMRMLAQYDRLEVQAAVINAIFGAYIESPFDADDVQKALEEDGDGASISAYQRLRSDFHADNRLSAGSIRLAKLFPGEKVSTISSSRPAGAFDMFEAAMLRNLAVATGNSFETVSANFRGSTYSSARQALLEAWRTLTRRRRDFGRGWATPHYVALLEEMIEHGDVPLPAGAPDFAEARAEYARCRWIGPGRGWVDPTKEPEGSRMKIGAGLSTLEREAEENDGLDWEENLDQLALEQQAAQARGLTLTYTVTGGQQPDQSAPQDPPAGTKDDSP
ncbi:phage portal protein [Falsiroseomonas sp. CW058]|uniref:phage portal protein n=1 Tax=Falsiroseomonas sp. CW058 TaxID=3388664 RepID=UPI003D3230DD